jgi:hypothetical protein
VTARRSREEESMASEERCPEAPDATLAGPAPDGPAGVDPAGAGAAGSAAQAGPPGPVAAADPAGTLPPAGPTRAGPDQGDSRWSVARLRWKALLPDLPDDVIALLAAPIVVSVDPRGDARRVDEDDDKEEQHERYPAPVDPCAALLIRHDDRRPRFLASACLGPTVAARHRG